MNTSYAMDPFAILLNKLYVIQVMLIMYDFKFNVRGIIRLWTHAGCPLIYQHEKSSQCPEYQDYFKGNMAPYLF